MFASIARLQTLSYLCGLSGGTFSIEWPRSVVGARFFYFHLKSHRVAYMSQPSPNTTFNQMTHNVLTTYGCGPDGTRCILHDGIGCPLNVVLHRGHFAILRGSRDNQYIFKTIKDTCVSRMCRMAFIYYFRLINRSA